MTLTNTSSSPLAFKVKTTAPKLYCVRPNASVVEPNDSVKISIILQGFAQPLPKDFKCKDKFLIVSLPCPELEDAQKVGEIWSSLEAKYKEQLVSKKLRVNYVITDSDEDHVANGAAGVGAGAAGASAAAASIGLTAPSVPVGSSSISTPERPSDKSINDAYTTPSRDQSNGTGQAQSGDDLQKELDASNAEINNLSQKLDSNEKVDSSKVTSGEKSSSQAATSEEPVSGISIPFAIILVILAFILSWLIF